MAKKAKAARTALRKGASKGTKKALAKKSASKPRERGAARKRTRPEEATFPEMGNLKDGVAMKHAKAYADEMFSVEEAQSAADGEKQAVFQRMRKLGAEHFTGHGYEFHVQHGEDKFTVRKIKRGSKPAQETPVDEGGDVRPEPDFETDGEGRPTGDDAQPGEE